MLREKSMMLSTISLVALFAASLALPTRHRVSTTSGLLRGIHEATPAGPINKYLGVRFAEPPVGALRFAPPAELKVNSEHRVDATEYAPSCMQPPHLKSVIYPQLLRRDEYQVNEDCLYLDIYVPADADQTNLPVMIWIPGEGYSYGMSHHFDGTRLALHGRTIVVAINYRLSVFGFLSTGDHVVPGNVGLLDQLAAIRWVKRNIKKFGGDPQSITVFGRLSGAMSISALLASPKSIDQEDGQPLFQRIIIQSGVAGEHWTVDRHPLSGVRHLAHSVNCSSESSEAMISCLRRVPADELSNHALLTHSWRLVVDNKTLLGEPLKVISQGRMTVPGISALIGMTNDEGSLCLLAHFALKTKYFDLIMKDTLTKEDLNSIFSKNVEDFYNKKDKHFTDQVLNHYQQLSNNLREQYLAMCGDMYIRSRAVELAVALDQQGETAFLYEFNHRPAVSFHPDFIRGAHGDDIIFSFGAVHDSIEELSDDEKELSNTMMKALANFAKSGDPNPVPGLKESWPIFDSSERQYLEFSLNPKSSVRSLSKDWRMDFWMKTAKELLS